MLLHRPAHFLAHNRLYYCCKPDHRHILQSAQQKQHHHHRHGGRHRQSIARSMATGSANDQQQQLIHDLAAAAAAAAPRIAPFIRRTPLEPSPWLSAAGGCRAWLKLESEQVTGSFKARGAVNKLLLLPPEQRAAGLVTCSTGNHALAFVHAVSAVCGGGGGQGGDGESTGSGSGSGALDRALVYLPKTAAPAKIAKLRARGARLELHGADCLDAELAARAAAAQRGLAYVSPYNDNDVMAGQGTVAIEILEQLREQQGKQQSQQQSEGDGDNDHLVVYVPVGGGGLIGGMAAVLKRALGARATVVGCQPAASDVMRQSVVAGAVVDAPSDDTLSDATAGGIEPGAVTLAPCIAAVDEWVTVSEQEIADAMASMLAHHSKLIEGAAGCAVAAFWRQRAALAGKRAVVLCCGGNVGLETLKDVLARGRVLGYKSD